MLASLLESTLTNTKLRWSLPAWSVLWPDANLVITNFQMSLIHADSVFLRNSAGNPSIMIMKGHPMNDEFLKQLLAEQKRQHQELIEATKLTIAIATLAIARQLDIERLELDLKAGLTIAISHEEFSDTAKQLLGGMVEAVTAAADSTKAKH